ncbi:MAG: phosphate ABC transporter permease subunit PstC [Gammaproteobacteria bacterium]
MIFVLWLVAVVAAAVFIARRFLPLAGAALACSGALMVVASGFVVWVLSQFAPLPLWAVYGIPVFCGVSALAGGRGQNRRTAREKWEKKILTCLRLCAAVAIVITAGIVLSVAAESWRFFQLVSPFEFLFSLEWSPQIAIREDQAGASGSFGVVPVLLGTLLITAIAMSVAFPVGLLSAIFLSEFASNKTRNRIKPMMEMLAGMPTVVYGFFAVVTLSPLLRTLGESLGADIAGESALAAGLVMALLLIPFVASLAEDALSAAPDSLRQGALALGATRYETVFSVVLPSAMPGVFAGALLAASRAVGETMIVVMAAGIAAHLSINPLQAVTTVTVQIVTMLTGDQEFDDPKTLAAFALGLLLFVLTLAMNAAALRFVRRHKKNNSDD